MRVVSQVHVGSPVRCVRFDASGRYVAVLVQSTEDIILFELDGMVLRERARLPSAIPSDAPLASLAFHPERPVLALASQDRTLGLWDVERGVAVGELGDLPPPEPAHERGYWGVCFSENGRHLESHSMRRRVGERYDWQTGRKLSDRFGPGGSLALHPEGALMAVCSVAEMATTTWFAEGSAGNTRWYSAELVCWFPVTRVVFGPGALGFIGGSGITTVQVHDFPSCDIRFEVKLDPNPDDVEFPWGVSEAIAFSPDGACLFAPSASGEVLALDGATGARSVCFRAHQGLVTSLDLHPHAPFIVSGGADGVVALAHDPKRDWTRRGSVGEAVDFIARFPVLPGEPNAGPCTVIEP